MPEVHEIRPHWSSADWLDAAIISTLMVLLTFSVLALGTVSAWSQAIAAELAGVAALAIGVKALVKPCGLFPRTVAFVPMGLFVALAVLQLAPHLMVWVSPQTVAMKRELLADLWERSDRTPVDSLTFYRWATRHDLRELWLVCIIFLAALTSLNTRRRIIFFLSFVALLGGGLAILALAQDFTHAAGIYWRYEVPGDTAWSGTFVDHGHFGQHMNLCIGAMLALLFLTLDEGGKKLARGNWQWILPLSLTATIAVAAAAIIHSGSRGAMLGGVISLASVVFILLAMRGRSRVTGVTFVVLVLIATVAATERDRISGRLEALKRTPDLAARAEILDDLWKIACRFPLTGTGLGTHQTFYPRFETPESTGLSTHAENEYAQAMEEMGFVGLGCVVVFMAVLWTNWARAIRGNSMGMGLAVLGIGYGLLAVQIHSLSDFGEHFPAVAGLTAVMCAIVMNLGLAASPLSSGERVGVRGVLENRESLDSERFAPHPSPLPRVGGRGSRTVDIAFAVILVGAGGWSIFGARREALAESHWDLAAGIAQSLRSRQWQGGDAEFADLLSQATQAANLEPDSAYYRLWLSVYRWHQATAHDSDAPANAAVGQSIVNDLNGARLNCPTFGSLQLFEGELERDVLHRPISRLHLQQAALLMPHDASSLVQAGEIDARLELWEDADRLFTHAIMLDSRVGTRVYNIVVDQCGRGDQAVKISSDLWTWQLELSQKLPSPELRDIARMQAMAELVVLCRDPGKSADYPAILANQYLQIGDDESGVLYLDRALAKDPRNVPWRIWRAQALVRLGRLSEARRDVKRAYELNPHDPSAGIMMRTLVEGNEPDHPAE